MMQYMHYITIHIRHTHTSIQLTVQHMLFKTITLHDKKHTLLQSYLENVCFTVYNIITSQNLYHSKHTIYTNNKKQKNAIIQKTYIRYNIHSQKFLQKSNEKDMFKQLKLYIYIYILKFIAYMYNIANGNAEINSNIIRHANTTYIHRLMSCKYT